MVSLIVYFCLGGFFGWVYGGNAIGYTERMFGKHAGKIVNTIDKVVYYIAYGVAFSFALPILNFVSFLILVASQWARRAVSWGKYIGVMIHGRIELNDGRGVKFLDDLLFKDGNVSHKKLRGCAALSVIGAAGGFILAVGIVSAFAVVSPLAPAKIFLLIPALAFKGPIYWACIEIAGALWGQDEPDRRKGWWLSEVIYNGYMWAVACYLLFSSDAALLAMGYN